MDNTLSRSNTVDIYYEPDLGTFSWEMFGKNHWVAGRKEGASPNDCSNNIQTVNIHDILEDRATSIESLRSTEPSVDTYLDPQMILYLTSIFLEVFQHMWKPPCQKNVFGLLYESIDTYF
jgi:hypothetical protein